MFRRHALLLILSISAALSAHAQSVGPFPVESVGSITVQDSTRGKEMTVRLYYPAGEGPFPVLVFSHGLGGNKDAFSGVSTHWASHGYVVVHPTHDDRGVTMGAGGMNPPAEKVLDRVRDVSAVLDGLDQLEASAPALRGKLDRSRIGVAGHSYGSFITQLVGGARATIGAEALKSVADSRVQCVIPIAPGGRGDYGMSEESWKSLSIPALYFNGTNDVRSGRAADWRHEPFLFASGPNKYMVVIEGASHGSYGAEGDPSNAPAYVKAAGVAFWNACLKGSDADREYLTAANGFATFAGTKAVLKSK